MIYSNIVILLVLGSEKEHTVEISNDLDESYRYFAEWEVKWQRWHDVIEKITREP